MILLVLRIWKVKNLIKHTSIFEYIKNVIRNFYEAPLPNYKESALYFHLLYNNEKMFNTCIMQLNIKIDAGKITNY